MSNTISFEEFLQAYGLQVWRVTAKSRGQRHHGGGYCPAGKPAILGGPGRCHPCEMDYDDTLLELKGGWWSEPPSR